MDVLELLRPSIRLVKPYSSARDEFSETSNQYLFLDANENSIGSVGSLESYNRYPDPHQYALKQLLAPLKGVRTGQIFLGNGSDEAIDLLFRAFCEPKRDEVILLPPTYGMYAVCASINDVRVREVSLTSDYQLNVPAILEAITERTKLIFLCSPNNPTANLLRPDDVLTLLRAVQTAVVVVDEAYIDFAGQEASMLRQLDTFERLVVLQTFSKAWGLANLRLGMAFGAERLMEVFANIKPPYNVNGYTQSVAIRALQNLDQQCAMVGRLLEARRQLAQNLAAIKGIARVYPSDANFLLVKTHPNASAVYADLLAAGVVVRNRANVHLCEGCLRITVGTERENETLLVALKAIFTEKN